MNVVFPGVSEPDLHDLHERHFSGDDLRAALQLPAGLQPAAVLEAPPADDQHAALVYLEESCQVPSPSLLSSHNNQWMLVVLL